MCIAVVLRTFKVILIFLLTYYVNWIIGRWMLVEYISNTFNAIVSRYHYSDAVLLFLIFLIYVM